MSEAMEMENNANENVRGKVKMSPIDNPLSLRGEFNLIDLRDEISWLTSSKIKCKVSRCMAQIFIHLCLSKYREWIASHARFPRAVFPHVHINFHPLVEPLINGSVDIENVFLLFMCSVG